MNNFNNSNLQEKLEKILLKVQKPAQYIGGELNSVIKDKTNIDIRFAFCFPDTYSIGMSHLGMKILYAILNKKNNVWCERVFAPSVDFEMLMRENNIPLYGLESLDPINTFDIIGFTLQYELSYTNVLNMLNLAGIPLLSSDRDDTHPLIVAGGPTACNPEPVADFFDLFMIGEGEELLPFVVDEYNRYKKENKSKKEFLRYIATIEGIYVPSLYAVAYKEDGTIDSIIPTEKDIPHQINKVIIKDLDSVDYPKNFVVPFVDIVHDRAIVEVMRGCIRGCRFCQAGYIYRPLREKSADTLCSQGKSLCEETGYEEISLSSLSTSDYSNIETLLTNILDYTIDNKVNLSMPSMRIDNFSEELLDKIKAVRKSGLTFAPEAGTQRLRDVINKNILESDVLKSTKLAFMGGYNSVKLYFMLGLPTETFDDVAGIIRLSEKILDTFFTLEKRPAGGISITVSVATFVPKPHTPFQWVAQDKLEYINEKHKHLLHENKSKRIKIKYHESKTSVLEGVFARGDRKLCKVLLDAFNSGCKFDSWSEHFNFSLWESAMDKNNLSIEWYANRERSLDEILPWNHINHGVTQEFLKREYQKSLEGITTKNCREICTNCGAKDFVLGECVKSSNAKGDNTDD